VFKKTIFTSQISAFIDR